MQSILIAKQDVSGYPNKISTKPTKMANIKLRSQKITQRLLHKKQQYKAYIKNHMPFVRYSIAERNTY